MSAIFHPYRPQLTSRWSGFRRFFTEWRQRAIIRRELRTLSDRQCEDIGLKPRHYHHEAKTPLWWG
jgi:uncharacterized protein YjiS (DUF1127 family)